MSAGEEIDQANYKKQLERTQSSDSDAIKKEPPLKTDPRFVSQNFAQTYPVPHANTYQKILESCGKFFGGWGTFCCLCSNPYKEVREGDVGLVLTFGKLSKCLEPGLNYVNTWSEQLIKVNIKTNIREIPAQSCYTRDNVSVVITSVAYYNIIDPQKAIFSIDDIHSAVIERTQTTLRDVIGNRILQDVLEKREEIAESIEQIISKTAFDWGVNIESILIKDLQLPQSVQQSLSKASESKRIGEAKIIMAKAETDAARQMRKASDILSSPAALQIRYLDALQNMSKNPGTRVIFMPSSDAIEKIAHAPTANHQQQPLEPISENSTGRTDINQSREITNTMALQEALRDD
ncbi:hypothetical protein HYPBUDRAFT_107839 [Hyphopichia burtonii NRRL Y-1933]|uniref:Band 7 domain-containing protein n=1 Tax=Hyphopichia burtonii NRRL Y-1933 TaxID=984485 RepID=A0A1E4RL75_9ASCO|nr:hypothetical protein HYPBUDRAFT_107839 [Hyphopichia burtonii NRRL Y-1933]ODV68024.1 hypothetical protein HYPBUDRAFT_107839 [Hyphopichia burtonii NRRL Y-1933]